MSCFSKHNAQFNEFENHFVTNMNLLTTSVTFTYLIAYLARTVRRRHVVVVRRRDDDVRRRRYDDVTLCYVVTTMLRRRNWL